MTATPHQGQRGTGTRPGSRTTMASPNIPVQRPAPIVRSFIIALLPAPPNRFPAATDPQPAGNRSPGSSLGTGFRMSAAAGTRDQGRRSQDQQENGVHLVPCWLSRALGSSEQAGWARVSRFRRCMPAWRRSCCSTMFERRSRKARPWILRMARLSTRWLRSARSLSTRCGRPMPWSSRPGEAAGPANRVSTWPEITRE